MRDKFFGPAPKTFSVISNGTAEPLDFIDAQPSLRDLDECPLSPSDKSLGYSRGVPLGLHSELLLLEVVKAVSRALEVESMVTTTIRSLTGETVMPVDIGVDFHPHQQTVCWCDPDTGELKTQNLFHQAPALKQFYQTMPPALIGIDGFDQCRLV